jgi:uncharacterized membrane protein (DUF373 family)
MNSDVAGALHTRDPVFRSIVPVLVRLEHALFVAVSALLWVCAILTLASTVPLVWQMALGDWTTAALTATSHVLDRILAVLIFAELAYTVSVPLRGKMLTAEPFLIVGLMAVVRRILVLTMSGVPGYEGVGAQGSPLESVVLTALCLALVIGIAILRSQTLARRFLRLRTR